MKTRDFERLLTNAGFVLVRVNGHRIWSNGQRHVAVTKDRTIHRGIARRILKEIGYSEKVPELNFG